jgi:2'-5' RNA ligase
MESHMANRHTLFCALRPPREAACDLWDDLDWLPRGDDRVEPERQHVTLVPLGAWRSPPEEVVARARKVCASLTIAPFRTVFDELIVAGRILLKPSETVRKLAQFQQQLAVALDSAGLIGPNGYRFSPHLTLSYRTRAREQVIVPAVSWTVRDFVLIESLVGERKQIERGRWALHGWTPPASRQ